MNDVEALATAQRLSELGIAIKSPSLAATANGINEFNARGGNRQMRRAAKRSQRRRGR